MKRNSATVWIFVAMAAGILLGHLNPEIAKTLEPVSHIFLKLIKSIIAPLLFATLVYGIAASGNVKTMGRIGGKAILYFEIATTIALFIGLFAVNWIKPGVSQTQTQAVEQTAPAKPVVEVKKQPTAGEILEHTFPSSVIDAMARGDVLQLVVFCFLFGAACTAIGDKAKPVIEWCESLAEIMFQYTRYVMMLAPLGVGAAIAVTVGTYGLSSLNKLGLLLLTMYAALIVFVVVVFGAVILICRIPLGRFIDAAKEPWLIAFSTASSEAALPKALENMEKFGVPKHIVSFVLPTGYSFNLDGTTLYLSGASIFCAQVAGIELTFGQQVLMMLSLMLTSKGVAGVPRASLVILTGTLTTFAIPQMGITLILGIDAVLDMARTSVNVLGNCLASAVVARWEGVDLSKAPALEESRGH
ncbi:MAG: cation:dicarboxylase symporter family transporter [Acidobacteria bacterium]|nr:cation:dicarboxylase symporter family transporter [Acidobacteriota bacterium]